MPRIRSQAISKRLTNERAVADTPSPLQGKRVVFTGTLTTMSRNQAKLLLCQVGGYPQNALGPSTDYLVMGETNMAVVDHRTGTSSKFRKAMKRGIPILSETEFLAMLAPTTSESSPPARAAGAG